MAANRMCFLVLLSLTATLVSATTVPASNRQLNMGDRCTQTPDNCRSPLSCVGHPLNLRCFEKRSLGMNCGKDPFWVCQRGLICADGTCKVPVERAGRCGLPVLACIPPLSCVGRRVNRRCFMKKGLGMKCGQDPFWVCQDGLTCNRNTCRTLVDRAGRCGTPDLICKKPFRCVGLPVNRRCFELKQEGMKCGQDPFWICARGLRCVDNRCAQA